MNLPFNAEKYKKTFAYIEKCVTIELCCFLWQKQIFPSENNLDEYVNKPIGYKQKGATLTWVT